MTLQATALGQSAGLGSRLETLRAAGVALMLGVGIVFTVGFAHIDAVHNAAHDWRHSNGFPCH